MNKQIYNLYKVLFLFFISIFNVAYASTYAASGIDKNWQFKVYLDGDEIGFHNFSMVHKEQHQEIYSSARFDVKFLFFNAYSYRHDNVELWHGQCLNSINAVTDDNGEKYKVIGKVDNDTFVVNTA